MSYVKGGVSLMKKVGSLISIMLLSFTLTFGSQTEAPKYDETSKIDHPVMSIHQDPTVGGVG